MIEIFDSLRKFNFWDKSPQDVGYIRQSYITQLSKALGNRLVKVLIGQRRSGKSVVMRQIIKYLIEEKKVDPKNIFYLNKEWVEFDDIRSFIDLKKCMDYYEKTLKVKGKIYVFLDEIQEITEWEKIVNALSQDHVRNYEVFITGSNSNLLSGELATYLSGRYIAFDILPFSYTEYIGARSQSRNRNSYIQYLKEGGLPELLHLDDEQIRRNYVESLYSTIILKDVVHRHKIKDVGLLERIFRFLVDNIGNAFSTKSIVDYLNSNKIKTNFETVNTYIHHLTQAILFHEVERYDLKGKQILSSTKKYYLNDLIFKTHFSSGFDVGLSKQLENSIYLYFRQNGYKLFVGKIGVNEVDFIAEKGQSKQYIQVAFGLTDDKVIEREFSNLEKINDAYEKWVISLDETPFNNRHGIKIIQAWMLE